MSEKKSNLGYKITIFLLSAIIIWLVIDKITTRKKIVQQITVIEEVSKEKDSLRNELEQMYLSYSDLETNNQALNDSLAAEQQKIKDLLDELENVKSSDNYRIQQLKDEVETLKKIMKSYVRQIDSLYQENQVLIAENTKIKKDFEQKVEQTEVLTEQKDSLEQTVNVAKELTAYSISLSALNRRGKETNRTRKLRKFQVCFVLSENKVVNKGRKYVYIRVTKPNGKVLRNDQSGFFNFEGKSIAYSAVKEIEYNGSSQNICMYYKRILDDLPRGDYTVFIFIDGSEIGNKKIYLK